MAVDSLSRMLTTSVLDIEICRDAALWDAYVDSMPEASNYHRWAWKRVVEETYGHQTYYLAATGDGTTQGVLPLVSIKSRLFGNFLVSMPYFSYGGVLASTLAAEERLLAKAIEIAREIGARHVELRQGGPCGYGWEEATSKVTMLVELPATTDDLWNRLSSGMRNKVRSARKRGLRVQWGGLEDAKAFYKIFAVNMRNLGTPVYPPQWFENMCRFFPGENRIVTLYDEGQAVASGITTAYRGTVDWPWSATLPESRRKYSAVLLYWTLLEWALENGYRRVDLGRCTPGSGVHEFKRHWNCEERPLHWYYWLSPGAPLPQLRPDSPRYLWATRIWQRLPIGVANRLGPRIVRSIP